MIIIIYGLSGAGKSYVANVFEKYFGFFNWDGDNALPEEMVVAVREKQVFTQEMRNKLTKKMTDTITHLQLLLGNRNIVISIAGEKVKPFFQKVKM